MRSMFLVWMAAAIGTAIFAQTNPVPLISMPLAPDAVAPGSGGITLTVNGSGFAPTSVVNWSGSARATTFVSRSKLTAAILAADVASVGTATVTVSTPAPGGGTSNVAYFEVTEPGTVAFAVSSSPTNIEQPYPVAVDVNHDGKLDLVFGAYQEVVVMLGNGDGTFQVPQVFPSGGASTPIVVADFNNDGKLDVAAADSNCSGCGISILLGNGDGTFQPAATFGQFSGTYAIATGDFNGDGKLDLALTDGSSHVVVLLGNGNGTFQGAVNYALEASANALVVGDFNGDGRPDLAASGSSGISILIGNGDGTFQAPSTIAGAAYGYTVTADLNGDGILDLAAISNGKLHILLGKGDGSFEAPVTYAAGTSPGEMVTGDFNGDGNADIAVIDSGSARGAVSILPGNGDGTFRAPLSTATPGYPETLAGGDFNNDGRLDLAFGQYFRQAEAYLLSIALQTTAVVSPPLVSFPITLEGKSAAPKTVTVTNNGAAPLNITQTSLTGTDAGDFSLSANGCQGGTIPAGGNCTVGVSFSPTAPGYRLASLAFTDGAAASPQSIVLTGEATAARLTPAKLDFGQVKVRTLSTSRLISVTNVGKVPIEFHTNGIKVTGRDHRDFYESTTCGEHLGAKASCSIMITFAPTKKGQRTATVSVEINLVLYSNPKEIPISGEGI